jgi:hypothetical protein
MRVAPQARVAFVTPSHQFPTGVALSMARRLDLLAWARQSGALLFPMSPTRTSRGVRQRSRRFGLGFEMPEGPFRYKSAHTPFPLSEIEEALLVGAGAGFWRAGWKSKP